jgi:hypothetical protein
MALLHSSPFNAFFTFYILFQAKNLALSKDLTLIIALHVTQFLM